MVSRVVYSSRLADLLHEEGTSTGIAANTRLHGIGTAGALFCCWPTGKIVDAWAVRRRSVSESINDSLLTSNKSCAMLPSEANCASR